MPKGVVKTKRDEVKWDKAKEITRKQYPEMGESDNEFWKIVNSIYQNMSKAMQVNMSLLQKAVDLSFLCPETTNERTLAKNLYYLLDNHFDNLHKSRKLHKRYKFQGLNISIENKKGSIRHWHDPLKDENGETKMKCDYGYIRLTEGADGDHVDVYIGPDKEAGRVYVIHQNNPKNGEYDEDKVMLGFNSADEAKTEYLKHYDDPKFFGSIEEYNFLTFADKVMKKKGKVTGNSLEMVDELQKAVKIKKNYSSEELKNLNMRWVTIRGNHVLVQGMSDGSYVVVGGAGGKLNHMRIDSLLSPKEYAARRKEKKSAQLVDLTEEEIKEQAKQRKEEITQKKAARSSYETTVKEILGIDAEDFKASISAQEMDELYADAKKKVARKKKLEEGVEPKKEDIEEEAQELIDERLNEEVKKAEKTALDTLADDFFGEDIEEDTKEDLKKRIDSDTAMEILKARKMFRATLKGINKPEKRKKRLSFTDTYAKSEDFKDEEILQEVKQHIETQQNVRLYEHLDRQSEAIQKHIDSGGAEALNGIVGDVYPGGAVLSSEIVQALGMDACVQIIANKLYSDGNAEKVKEALIRFTQKNNSKTVKSALKEMEIRFHNADVIRDMSGKEDDPDAILSVASANGYALRQLTRGQHILGSAVGSLRSSAHLINAIEEGAQDKVFIDMGNNLARARKNAIKAGFKRGEYKMKSQVGGKNFIMEIPKKSCEKFFDNNKAVKAERTKLDRIKSLQENDGYIPDGIKEGIKLDPSQEAALRFFNESEKVLLDFEAGLGKTAIAYAAIAEAMNNKGVKKVLFVTPAKLRTQTSEESKVFLDKEHQKHVMNTDGKTIAERKAIYAQEGIHFIGHDQLRTDAKHLKEAGYDMIVVDEIHEMTNQRDTSGGGKADSGRYRGMMTLSDIPLKIGMSGTNIKSSKKEYYKKINFIDPDHDLGTMKEFESRYKGLNQGSNAFQDSSNDAFRKESAKYSFTQKKKLKIQNYQEEIREPMTPSQKKAYKASEKLYIEEKNSLSERKSKGAAARRDVRNYDIVHNGYGQFENSKMSSIVNKMDTVHDGEKAVIHCYRKKAIKTAVKELEAKYGKGSVAVIDGDSSRGHVSKTKAAYNDPSNKLRFLIGTKSVEAGLNLQHGGRVTFHLDVPLDEASKEQREGRQFRRGQESDCHSYMLVTETPFDINKVDQMQRKGREMRILGNPSTVESNDENGFLTMLNQVEKEQGYGA